VDLSGIGATALQELVALAQTTREEARKERRRTTSTAESSRSPRAVQHARPTNASFGSATGLPTRPANTRSSVDRTRLTLGRPPTSA
jgi:hypothetical protein